MSLARLLTAAKALTTFNESPTAYRVRRAALLPKFGATKNPFNSEKQVEAANTQDPPAAASAVHRNVRWSFWWWRRRDGTKEIRVEGKSKIQPKAGPPRGARTPSQGELLLDHVKVVRNDLRDSDVDILARSGDTGTKRPTVAANWMLGALAAERVLDRLADRIVGSGTP